MEQEKSKQILMKNNKQKTVQSFFIRTILKEQWDLLENKNNQGWNQYKKLFIQVLKTEMHCN